METILEVAERFEVGDSFIKKLLRRKRTTGTIAPIRHRGGQPKLLSDKHRKWLLKTVLAAPDITLKDLREQLLNEYWVSASVPTLLARVAGVEPTAQKKSVVARERNRRKRARRWRRMKKLRHEHLRFLDEAGATTILTRLYARAVGGAERLKPCAQLRSVNLDD